MHLIRKLAAVAPVAALALAVPALSANASTHGPRPMFHPAVRPDTVGQPTYAMQSAGYNVTGTATTTNFKTVSETATLQDPSQFASVTNGLGWGLTLKSGSVEVDLGISDSTVPHTAYSPAVDLFLNGVLQTGAPDYNAQWCAAGGTCQPATEGGSFAFGDSVTETLSFNPADGVLDYAAYDAHGNVFTGQFGGLKGQKFSEADVGGGFGSFSAPATPERFVTFRGVSLVTYSGKHVKLSSSAVNAAPQIATSDGTSGGTVQAKPSALSSTGNGFSITFKPAAG